MLVDHGPPRKKLDGTGLHKRADMITWSRMHASFCFLSKLFTGHESLSSPVPSVPQVHTSSNQIRIHSFTSCRTYSNGFLFAWALQVATPSQTYPDDPRNFLTTTWKTGQIDAQNGFPWDFSFSDACCENIGKHRFQPWKSFGKISTPKPGSTTCESANRPPYLKVEKAWQQNTHFDQPVDPTIYYDLLI